MASEQTPPLPTALGLRRHIWLVGSYLVTLTVLGGCALALPLTLLPFAAAGFLLGALPVAVAVVALRAIRHVRRVYTAASGPLLSMGTYFNRPCDEKPDEKRRAKALEDIEALGVALHRRVLGLPAAPADRLKAFLAEARTAVRAHTDEPAAVREAREDVLRWHDTLA